jgi:hypothetical protein
VDLLDNQATKIDVAALARALGDPPSAFGWSTLDALPAPRITLAEPQPRVCLACLASGYHSALFSVALLGACPIHHTPLVDRCRCGARLTPRYCPLQTSERQEVVSVAGCTILHTRPVVNRR